MRTLISKLEDLNRSIKSEIEGEPSIFNPIYFKWILSPAHNSYFIWICMCDFLLVCVWLLVCMCVCVCVCVCVIWLFFNHVLIEWNQNKDYGKTKSVCVCLHVSTCVQENLPMDSYGQYFALCIYTTMQIFNFYLLEYFWCVHCVVYANNVSVYVRTCTYIMYAHT